MGILISHAFEEFKSTCEWIHFFKEILMILGVHHTNFKVLSFLVLFFICVLELAKQLHKLDQCSMLCLSSMGANIIEQLCIFICNRENRILLWVLTTWTNNIYSHRFSDVQQFANKFPHQYARNKLKFTN